MEHVGVTLRNRGWGKGLSHVESTRLGIRNRFRRKGGIAVLAATLLVVFIVILAFAIDLGYIASVKTEAQRCADAAAFAGAWDLLGEDRLRGDYALVFTRASEKAVELAAHNKIGRPNTFVKNEPVQSGPRWRHPHRKTQRSNNQHETLTYYHPQGVNALQVTVRCTEESQSTVAIVLCSALGQELLQYGGYCHCGIHR